MEPRLLAGVTIKPLTPELAPSRECSIDACPKATTVRVVAADGQRLDPDQRRSSLNRDPDGGWASWGWPAGLGCQRGRVDQRWRCGWAWPVLKITAAP